MATRESPAATSTNAPTVRVKAGKWLGQLLSGLQFLVALGVTVAFLLFLLFYPAAKPKEEDAAAPPPKKPIVEVIGPSLIHVEPGSPFDSKLQVAQVRSVTLTNPLLNSTGRVVASLRPDERSQELSWQFSAPEMLNVFTDWQKSQADITFVETQLERVNELADARLDAQTNVVQLLTKTVATGTDAAKDLKAEKAKLIETKIQGKKDVHEAESAVRVAKRSEAALRRQLQQAGLDPAMLLAAHSDVDVVMADVPEAKANLIKVGQACRAVFFGIPDETFTGKVHTIAPALSSERRSLRVLFFIDDPGDQLRPGMFAEIGLGTDPREALLAPTDAILHVGRTEYALAALPDEAWQVVAVKVGEPHNGDIEILSGLTEGQRIIGKGAILFKPLVVQALQQPAGDHVALEQAR
jgi:multidrug efflux pump subunit AcrA (membrane-fusion protein)